MVALTFIAFLLVAGIGYLTLLGHNFRFQHKEFMNARAFYLATSGVEYYMHRRYKSAPVPRPDPVPPTMPASTKVAPLEVRPAAGEVIRVYEEAGEICSHGVVEDAGGRVLAFRVVRMPVADVNKMGKFRDRLGIYEEGL